MAQIIPKIFDWNQSTCHTELFPSPVSAAKMILLLLHRPEGETRFLKHFTSPARIQHHPAVIMESAEITLNIGMY